MADEINADLITKVVQHDYFKFLVEKEVQAQTQAQLSLWWKIVVGILTVVLAILAAFGIPEYLRFRNLVANIQTIRDTLNDKAAAVDKQLTAANELENRVNRQVTDVSQHVTEAEKNTSRSVDLVKSSQDLLSQGASAINSSMSLVAGQEQNLANLAKSLKDANESIEARLKLLPNRDELEKTKKDIDQTKDRVAADYNEIDEKAKKVGNLDEQLNKVKTLAFVFLQAGDPRERVVSDYKDLSKKQNVVFIAKKIKKSLDLTVELEGKEQQFSYLKEGDERRIRDTDNLWFKVEAIRQRYLLFAHPFAILRVFVKDEDQKVSAAK